MANTSSSTSASSSLARGYLICIASAGALAFTGIFISYLTREHNLPPLVLAFWRDIIVTASLGLIFFLFKKPLLSAPRGQVAFLFAYGLVLTLFNTLWTFSVAFNGAAVGTVLAYSSTAFTALLARWLFKESLDWVKMLAVVLGLTGCVFISGAYQAEAWSINPAGIITGVLAGLAFAVFSLMGKASSNRKINSWTSQLYAFGFATLFFFPIVIGFSIFQKISPATGFFWLGNNWIGWAALIILAVGPTLGGYGLYMLSLTYLPASIVNIIALLEPPLTALLAFFLLSEVLTPPQLLGSALIISSVVIVRIFEKK